MASPDPIRLMEQVHLEIRRHSLMLSLRKDLERHIINLTSRAPANEALNAWLFTQLARSHAAGLVQPAEQLFVPLVPPGDALGVGGVSGGAWPLVKYFERARSRAGEPPDDSLDHALAESTDLWLRSRWAECRAQLDGEAANVPAAIQVHGGHVGNDGSYRVYLEPRPPRQRSEHTVNAERFCILRAGYVECDEQFDTRLFLLMHRYATLFGPHSTEGRGWQLATPPSAMDLLGSDFGGSAECFR